MTLKDSLDGYMEYLLSARQIAPTTESKYRECFNKWIIPALGSKGLHELTPVDVIELRSAMRHRSLSPARQYSVIMCLKSLLGYSRRILRIDTLDPREIDLPRRHTPTVVYLTNDEIAKLVAAIDVNHFSGIRLRALIELILATGLRISEALSLERAPFENGADQLEIVGKGQRLRAVFFSERCRYWIAAYLRRRFDTHPSLFITTGVAPRKLCREDISRFFVRLRIRAGLAKKVTPHTLRHTFCTHLLFNGADITYIRDLAGHNDIQTTARYYLGKDKRVLRQAIEKHLHYDALEDRPAAAGLASE